MNAELRQFWRWVAAMTLAIIALMAAVAAVGSAGCSARQQMQAAGDCGG